MEQLKKLKLVDLFIIIILIILFLHLCISLFKGNEISQAYAKIDLVFRTVLSSIFGYVLSSNFISNKVAEPKVIVDKENIKKERNIQVIIIGTMAIIILFMLVITRHFLQDINLNESTLSQMRDICVGCIGFLIGYVEN